MQSEGLEPQELATPQPPRAAAYELRPLSIGEVLDRTFTLYRSRFWLFAGIACIYGAIGLSGQLLNLLAKHQVIVHYGMQAGTVSALLGTYALLLFLLVPAAVTQAATVFAVSEVYLGREMTVGSALRGSIGRWYRYVGVALWTGWSAMWLPLTLSLPAGILLALMARNRNVGFAIVAGVLILIAVCTIPYGVWALLRNSLGVQATVIEGLPVRAAMRRSKTLTLGAKWKILVVGLVMWVLLSVAGVLQAPMVLLVVRSPLEEHLLAQSLSLFVNFLATSIVTPIGLIGLSLVYFDQRVRQEGFDVLMLLGQAPAPGPTAALPSLPVDAMPQPLPPAQPLPYAESSLDPADPIGDDGRI